jgi:aryl-alcohol dehydrogenase-like predicted oxidoreductase
MHVEPKPIVAYPWFSRLFFWKQRRTYGRVLDPGLLWGRSPWVFAALALLYGALDRKRSPIDPARREFAAAELAWCAAHQTGVIVYSPMQSGLLSGAFTRERSKALPPDDWRSRDPEFTGERLARNLRLADALKVIASRYRTSPAAVAVAWTLAWPGVTGAIVGAREPRQVDGWVDAATLELSSEDMQQIAAAIEASQAGSGPRTPSAAASVTSKKKWGG